MKWDTVHPVIMNGLSIMQFSSNTTLIDIPMWLPQKFLQPKTSAFISGKAHALPTRCCSECNKTCHPSTFCESLCLFIDISMHFAQEFHLSQFPDDQQKICFMSNLHFSVVEAHNTLFMLFINSQNVHAWNQLSSNYQGGLILGQYNFFIWKRTQTKVQQAGTRIQTFRSPDKHYFPF